MLSPHPSSVGSKPSEVRLRDSEGSARLHHLDFFRSLSSPCLLTDRFRYSRQPTSHRTILPSRPGSISQVLPPWPLGISVPRRQPSPRMQRAKGTQEDDLSLAEETVKITSQSHDDINNAEKAALDPSSQDEHDLLTDKGSSVRNVVLWVCAAVTFGIALGVKDGIGKASEYFAGYLLEQSLSVDNLFVFVLIFKYFKVPKMYQSRVLSFGIAGAIIFRAIMILLGTVTLQSFEVVTLLLALILLYSSYKLFSAEEEENDLADNFIVKTCQRFIPVTAYYDGDRFLTSQDGSWKATPLLLTVAIIELSDIAFAIDSIPAVFGVTRDPFIVFSSNLFAISGLRSLYILISESMSELQYLQPAIAVVLGFIGTKMILDFFGYHITTEVSLGFVATSLSAGVLLSLVGKSDSESKEGK